MIAHENRAVTPISSVYLADARRHPYHKLHVLCKLHTLWRAGENQLLCFQQNPDSFHKTPGWGTPSKSIEHNQPLPDSFSTTHQPHCPHFGVRRLAAAFPPSTSNAKRSAKQKIPPRVFIPSSASRGRWGSVAGVLPRWARRAAAPS